MKQPAILAVDGGGSKVEAALIGAGGEVLGAVRGRISVDEDVLYSLKGVAEVVSRLRIVAATAVGHESDEPIADVGVFCLAGADYPADDRRYERALAAKGWATRNVVRNDTMAVLRAGTDRGWGIGIVCGYGINCSGISPTGTTFRFPALGLISGDWGGGGELGPLALWAAVRGREGRGDHTLLERLVPEHFDLKTPAKVTAALHEGRLDEERLIELTPVLFRAAAQSDRVARELLDRQADEIVAMAGVAIRKLRMRDLDVEVVLGGGVFHNDDEAFIARVREGIGAIASRAVIRVLQSPPVVGVALLGLDEIGAPPSAAARLRADLTRRQLADDTPRGR